MLQLFIVETNAPLFNDGDGDILTSDNWIVGILSDAAAVAAINSNNLHDAMDKELSVQRMTIVLSTLKTLIVVAVSFYESKTVDSSPTKK